MRTRITKEKIDKASESLANIRPSHNEAFQVKQGAQFGMWEREITNYSGQGPVIRVIADTEDEVNVLAIIISRKLGYDMEPVTGDFHGVQAFKSMREG